MWNFITRETVVSAYVDFSEYVTLKTVIVDILNVSGSVMLIISVMQTLAAHGWYFRFPWDTCLTF